MSPKEANFFTNTSENLAIYLNVEYKLELVLRTGFKALYSFVTWNLYESHTTIYLQKYLLITTDSCAPWR